MLRVAIVGATSHVAKNLMVQNFQHNSWLVSGFARNLVALRTFVDHERLSIQCGLLSDFTDELDFDAVINCVGFGTPEKVRSAGPDLFRIAEEVDNRLLNWLVKHPKAIYVNFSSGAVYGSNHEQPIHAHATTSLCLSPMDPADFYRISKIHQEAKHRAYGGYSIIDLRLFSFFSRYIDLSGGYFLTDALNSIRSQMVLKTSPLEIFRDYVSPYDLFQLVDKCLQQTSVNVSVDVYSAKAISKTELLHNLKAAFGLVFENTTTVASSPTGIKPYYYTEDRAARSLFGYMPRDTSWESIRDEFNQMGLTQDGTSF